MAIDAQKKVALVRCFEVRVDGHDLGFWTKCEGLTVEYEVFEYQEGGTNDHVHRLPGRRKYQNLKLVRPLDDESERVEDWVTRMLDPSRPATAVVTVLDSSGAKVRSWNFVDVFPVRWSGPTLDAGGNQVATETLELAHGGFLRAG
jgi:phage tail-like protein